MGQVPMTGEAKEGLNRSNDLMTCIIPRLLSSVRKDFLAVFVPFYARLARPVSIFISLIIYDSAKLRNSRFLPLDHVVCIATSPATEHWRFRRGGKLHPWIGLRGQSALPDDNASKRPRARKTALLVDRALRCLSAVYRTNL